MFKRKNNKKGIIAMAGAMAIMGGMLAQATPAYAAAPAGGDTKVTYDNRQVLPDGNGEYGIIIPTAVAFTDETMSGNANLEITGIGGYDLTDWETLTVKASVKSEKGYQLQLDGDTSKYATYWLTYGDDSFKTGTNVNDITTRLGVGSDGQQAVIEGTADLQDKSKATVKGQYKDKLTYSFTQEANQKK